MAAESPTYTDVGDSPELLRLAEEVVRTQREHVLINDGEVLAVISPARPAKKRLPRGKVLTEEDSLFRLIGITHAFSFDRHFAQYGMVVLTPEMVVLTPENV